MEIEKCLDYGQGYDDTIVELFKAFKKFSDGYYELIDYGDDWWMCFNQNSEFNKIMKDAWERLDGEHNRIMTCIDIMQIALVGGYCNFDKFTDGVIEAYENGGGFRHKEVNDNGNSKK